jgi:hAT family protein
MSDLPDGDTIICAVPEGHEDFPDENMPDTPEPDLTLYEMTAEQRAEAIKKWKEHRSKHEKKKRDRSSHAYWYMKCEAIPGVFYAEVPGAPKILQEYRYTCTHCIVKRSLCKLFVVLESNRHGATTGMVKHLMRAHKITQASHFARLRGYQHGPGNTDYTEVDSWSNTQATRRRLTAREATRRFFVKHRTPFSTVESESFQEMFLAHNAQCAYRSRFTLRNGIFDDFKARRKDLVIELQFKCITMSLTLDIWTAPNRVPIFAIIGHWITADFQEREEVLDFIELTGSHTGELLAVYVEKLLKEINVTEKLFSITGDNAGNNSTLCNDLFKKLKAKYDDKIDSPVGKPRMRFHGKESWIRCLAHITSLICSDVLSDLNAGSAKEAKKMLDSWDAEHKCNTYILPDDGGRSSIAKVRLCNLWMLRSFPREHDWQNVSPRTKHRRPIYDVDTRWNAAFDMIEQFLDLEPEYIEYIKNHPQIACLLPTDHEIIALHQLRKVLTPFKTLTLRVSETMPSLSRSLDLYWDLDDIITQVVDGNGIYSELDSNVRRAFGKAKLKHVKYMEKLDRNSMIYAAHCLDPRHRASSIKAIMLDKADDVITSIKKYFGREWPEIATTTSPGLTPASNADSRPDGLSISHWKAIQQRREREREASAALATCELDRWLQSVPIEADELSYKDHDFVLNWWKDNHKQWPAMAAAARDLLACSASEVDVERLFSGCRDEYGLRRQSLKAETVRVMTLLRSAYEAQDQHDSDLIKYAMEQDVLANRNSILWRPADRIDSHIVGKCIICCLD